MSTRHGLRTLQLGEPGSDRRTRTRRVLTGETTTFLDRTAAEPDSRPYAAGERLALVDEALRTVAILEVDDVRAVGRDETRLIEITFHVVGRESGSRA